MIRRFGKTGMVKQWLSGCLVTIVQFLTIGSGLIIGRYDECHQLMRWRRNLTAAVPQRSLTLSPKRVASLTAAEPEGHSDAGTH